MIKINESKSIGSVIFVVEGENDEPQLLTHLFREVFGYSIVSYNKRTEQYIELQGKNKYSRVFIVPAEYSAVNKIGESHEYFDRIYETLSVKYRLDVENNAIYYIYDRDRESNRPGQIMKLISVFSNSRDNENNEMNGLILLSYPSLESYILNANADEGSFALGKDIKCYIGDKGYKIKDIRKEEVEQTANVMIEKIRNVTEFRMEDLDKFDVVNKNVFNYQEKKWQSESIYDTLSLISVALLDLGMLEMTY